MPKAKIKVMRCPTCNALVTMQDEYFPFCSDRCQRIDLGKWASGVYRITSPILDPDLLEEVESMKRNNNGGDEIQ
jgi:hypothetical protein